MNTQVYILNGCAKEHKNEVVPFAHIRTKDICNDTADLLERIDNAIEEIKGCTFSYTVREKGWNENEGVYMPKEETDVIKLDTLLCILERNIGGGING